MDFEVCRKLKADPATRDISVIFSHRRIDHRRQLRGLEIGAIDYITNPSTSPNWGAGSLGAAHQASARSA